MKIIREPGSFHRAEVEYEDGELTITLGVRPLTEVDRVKMHELLAVAVAAVKTALVAREML